MLFMVVPPVLLSRRDWCFFTLTLAGWRVAFQTDMVVSSPWSSCSMLVWLKPERVCYPFLAVLDFIAAVWMSSGGLWIVSTTFGRWWFLAFEFWFISDLLRSAVSRRYDCCHHNKGFSHMILSDLLPTLVHIFRLRCGLLFDV